MRSHQSPLLAAEEHDDGPPTSGCAAGWMLFKVGATNFRWMGALIGLSLAVTHLRKFTPCNKHPCLYIIFHTRQYQPSSAGLFVVLSASVQNGRGFTFTSNPSGFEASLSTLNHTLPSPVWDTRTRDEALEFCASPSMRSRIINDLVWQPSQIMMICSAVLVGALRTTHDYALLWGWPERMAMNIGIVEWITYGCVVFCAIFWSIGLSETFYAPDPDMSQHGCFYQYSTLPMMSAIAPTFLLLFSWVMQFKNLLRVRTSGDYLYSQVYQVPWRVVRRNVAEGLMSDAASSMLLPNVLADEMGSSSSDQPSSNQLLNAGRVGRRATFGQLFLQRSRTGIGMPLALKVRLQLSVTVGGVYVFGQLLLERLQDWNWNAVGFDVIITVVLMAATCAATSTTREAPGTIMQRVRRIYWRVLPGVFAGGLIGTTALPVFERAVFLCGQFVPWLLPADADPRNADIVGQGGTLFFGLIGPLVFHYVTACEEQAQQRFASMSAGGEEE